MALRRAARVLCTRVLTAQGQSTVAASSSALLPASSLCSTALPLSQCQGLPASTCWWQACLSQAAAVHQQLAASHTYTISVQTGNLRGAGSNTPAWIQLVGSNGKTDRLSIGETDEDSLERGSQRILSITTNEDIGQLRFLHVQRFPSSITDAGSGWFLHQITVDTPDGQRLVFPCNAWFGESDAGDSAGPLERHLLPAAENEVEDGQPVQVAASGVAVPHPDKIKYDAVKGVNRKGFGHGGEDAYFYCPGKDGKVFALGVADGVFMWREQGINSGDFSRTLMELAEQSVRAGFQDVVHILQSAADRIRTQGLKGSSTVCLALVDQAAGQLYAANLGDSGLLLLRSSNGTDYKVKFRTNQLEHDFGRPFQLGHHAHADNVDKADVAAMPLRRGDVIVMGTDGLLDNLSDSEIAREVATFRVKGAGASMIAQRLARLAFEASYDKHRMTPYSLAASEHFDMVYSGGKPDDITVLVAFCDE